MNNIEYNIRFYKLLQLFIGFFFILERNLNKAYNRNIQTEGVTKVNLHSTRTLANGVEMPLVGLGVYKMTEHEEAIQAIVKAIEVGYRAIDTAALYDNEAEVGEAIRHTSIPREELFITTKVWNSDQGYDNTLRAFEASLKKLDLQYVDLYLTHWPVQEKFEDTYRAIERLYDEKLIRVPGVSNHHAQHLEKLFIKANTAPMVNQVEVHPYLSQKELLTFCKANHVAVTAWSPLGRGQVLDDPEILAIGDKYGKTTAQIVLRWHLQKDVLIIPKSVKAHRIEENASIFDFEISSEDMEKINALNRNERIGQNPENFHFNF